MKRLILGGLLAAGCAAAGSDAALAADGYDDTGAWYLSPMAQYTLLDDKRVSKDHLGYQVGLGYDFARNFAVELALSNGSFRIRGSGASEKLNATSLDVLYKFLPVTSTFRPFLLVGAGGMTDYIGSPAENKAEWLAEAGVGLLTGLGSQSGSTRLQLRTEAKYRYEFIRNTQFVPNNPRDVILGVGLQFMFGAPTPPPPPVARALPPPPPPEPAPPPPPPSPAPPPTCVAPAGFQMDANCRIIEQTLVVRAVDFEFNSAELTSPARQTLDEVAASLVKQPELKVEIQGYTDSTGSADYNLHLSQKRAQSVRTYLISKGVNPAGLTAKGFGKANPIATNATTEGRAQNRRVAFQVTSAPEHVKVVSEEATPASVEAAKQGEPARAKKEHQEH
jgi:outer membrane protein OmpA-like peptidoglycan-associated protein